MAELKSGFKSVEFYLTGAAMLAKVIWKDFPTESVAALIAYTIARQAQKGFGMFNDVTQRYSWQTSEFWLTLLYAVLKSVFPDMPEESLLALFSWVGMRTGIKGLQNYKSAQNGTSQPPTA